MRTFVVITLLAVCSLNGVSKQLSPSQTRTAEIATAFNKYKHAVKEKYGVKKEKYKDVHCEPLVKPNIRDYSGVYEVPDLGFVINVQVANDGRVQANGYETNGEGNQQSRTFRLENAAISGALLTATRIYDNGTVEKFEGAFLTRTDRESPTDSGTTILGLGVLLSAPRELGSITYDKLFYQLKR